MLRHLTISNYAITDHLDLDFSEGMTVLTGETGAGKSITLDALGLALGDRADSRSVGSHADRCEVVAAFSVADNDAAGAWLADRDLGAGDDCLLRRVIGKDGKSRAYINGVPSTVQDLRQLGSLLIDIHGQHEHQSLQQREVQRALLDDYAGARALAAAVREGAQRCRQLQDRLQKLLSAGAEEAARLDLLRYQATELRAGAPRPAELAQMEDEHTALANADAILSNCRQAAELCDDDEAGIRRLLHRAHQLLAQLPQRPSALDSAMALLEDALIQVDEAHGAMSGWMSGFEADPERLQALDQQLGAIYDLARKYRTQPSELTDLLGRLEQELAQLDTGEEHIAALERQLAAERAELARQAGDLTARRRRAATRLEREVNRQLKQLSMENCSVRFELATTPDIGGHGAETVELLVSTNPEQAPGPLGRIASGGELSRIGLAIQVANSRTAAIPCLVFDEVDAGIGGAVAEVVGRLLRQLGEQCQVLCVTHLPQVAARAHHHFRVTRTRREGKAGTGVERLGEPERIEEIARMLGGIVITDQTRAHAREMVAG